MSMATIKMCWKTARWMTSRNSLQPTPPRARSKQQVFLEIYKGFIDILGRCSHPHNFEDNSRKLSILVSTEKHRRNHLCRRRPLKGASTPSDVFVKAEAVLTPSLSPGRSTQESNDVLVFRWLLHRPLRGQATNDASCVWRGQRQPHQMTMQVS